MLDSRNLRSDLIAVGLLGTAAFLGLSLLTFDPADPPGTSVYPRNLQLSNVCGYVGAMAAYWTLVSIGQVAYFVVATAAVVAVILIRQRLVGEPISRTFGWMLALIGLCTLAALAYPSTWNGPEIGPGGYLGATFRGLLQQNFAAVGGYILTLSCIASGMLLCTDYTLIKATLWITTAPKRGWQRNSAVIEKTRRGGRANRRIKEAGKEVEEGLNDIPIRRRAEVAEKLENSEEEPHDESPDTDNENDEPGISISSRLASALRIRGKSSETSIDPREAMRAELDAASLGDEAGDYELPPLDLLEEGETEFSEEHERFIRRNASILEKTFNSFGFQVKVVEVETGPVISQYEVELEAGLRLSKITGLADDLAIALRVPSVRVVAPIPGKNTVGIEVPNAQRQLVRAREVIEQSVLVARQSRIPLYLGKDVAGNPLVVDLATLPHLLIAGRTGTGKSVCLNSIIISMLMTRRPDEVRMLMIDPKMVELSPYRTLPHLMHPVVTDMHKAEAILAWAVEKMEERYSLLASAGVRHMSVYNQLGEDELRDRLAPETEEEWKQIPKHLPYIVIIADEMADLMMTAPKEVEQHIIRLAQKSRAVGIHLIMATQKPTVDVITGLIKSNLPARIAFQVASRTDSRVVLDEMGAEKLLGNGDMLFLCPGTNTVMRGQGTFVCDEEINEIVEFVGTDEPKFVKELVQLRPNNTKGAKGAQLNNRDELYTAAVEVVLRENRGSVSLLQRALGIGYGRAARLIDYMAEDGIVGQYNGSQAREILITWQEWQQMTEQQEEDSQPQRLPRMPRAALAMPKPSAVLAEEDGLSDDGDNIDSFTVDEAAENEGDDYEDGHYEDDESEELWDEDSEDETEELDDSTSRTVNH